MQRKLAAILAADVVGYSRLIAEDEARTLDALRALRRELFEPVIAEHRGEVVKRMGDGWLVSFGSVVDAAQCAIDVQERLTGHDRIKLRIGVHLGDIVHEDEDIYGDGVNIAARLQEAAEPGGVLISGTAYESLVGRLDSQFEDAGEQVLKNIARPVRAWKWLPASGTLRSFNRQGATDSDDSGQPTVAVLAFDNNSGDQDQEFLALGVAEEVINSLSRVRQLFVIARNSSFNYQNSKISVKKIGEELNVRYLVTGNLLKSGNNVRVTVQLIDALTSRQIWTDQYFGAYEMIFSFQDKISRQIAGVLEPTIREAEINRISRKHPENFNAYDYYLRALAKSDQFTKTGVEEAICNCETAYNLDPNFAQALALHARLYISKLVQGWFDAEDIKKPLELCYKAIEADRFDPFVCAISGHCFAFFERNLSKGIHYLDEALSISPSYAWGYLHSGVVRTFADRTAEAIQHFEMGERLSPRDARLCTFQAGRACALEIAGKIEDAHALAQRSVRSPQGQRYVVGWRVLASSSARLGKVEEAKSATKQLLEIDPNFTVSGFKNRYPFARPKAFEPVFQALIEAGVPSG